MAGHDGHPTAAPTAPYSAHPPTAAAPRSQRSRPGQQRPAPTPSAPTMRPHPTPVPPEPSKSPVMRASERGRRAPARLSGGNAIKRGYGGTRFVTVTDTPWGFLRPRRITAVPRSGWLDVVGTELLLRCARFGQHVNDGPAIADGGCCHGFVEVARQVDAAV